MHELMQVKLLDAIRRSLLSIDEMQIELPTTPVKMLLHSLKVCSPVSAESCEGIDLLRLLPNSIKYCSPISVESCEGIDLVRLLLYSDKKYSRVSVES